MMKYFPDNSEHFIAIDNSATNDGGTGMARALGVKFLNSRGREIKQGGGALKDLAERSATLAVELAGKIVDARLDPAAHSHLIEQAVSRFSAAEPGNN